MNLRSTDDKAGEQIEYRREVQLAAGPDDKLRGVPDPSLIRPRRLERLLEEIVGDRLVVIADRRVLVPLPHAGLEAVLLHQSHDAFAADANLLLDQVFMHARISSCSAARVRIEARRVRRTERRTSIGE